MRTGRFLWWCALLCTTATLWSTPASAQGNRRTNITVTGTPMTVTETTTTDFDAGSVTVGAVNYVVDLRTNSGQGGFSPRVTTVNVRCGPACAGNFARLQWRRNDLGTWNTLTTAYVTVESRTAEFDGINDPWNNSMIFRYQLGYAVDPPSGPTAYTLQFQLVVTAP